MTTPHATTARAAPERAARTVGVLVTTTSDPVAEVRDHVTAHPHQPTVVVLPQDASVALMRRVLVAGAAGIVLEQDPQVAHDDALDASVRAVAAGQLAVPAALVRQIAPRPLSHREKQVLGLVVEGCTNREIAQRLFVAESTVKTHLASVFAKLDAHSRAELVARVLDPDSGFAPSMLLAPA
jgi:DNA-binding NarL/FixJ family response regulator